MEQYSVNTTCLLSLTAHWIDDAFVKVSAVLHAQPVQEAHTGEHIAAQMVNMLQSWEIAHDKVHVVALLKFECYFNTFRDVQLHV